MRIFERRPVRIGLTVLRVGLGLGLLYYVLFQQGHWEAIRDFVSTRWLLPALAGFTLFGGAIEAVPHGEHPSSIPLKR